MQKFIIAADHQAADKLARIMSNYFNVEVKVSDAETMGYKNLTVDSERPGMSLTKIDAMQNFGYTFAAGWQACKEYLKK